MRVARRWSDRVALVFRRQLRVALDRIGKRRADESGDLASLPTHHTTPRTTLDESNHPALPCGWAFTRLARTELLSL